MAEKVHTKVVRFRILKPAHDTSWKDLASALRDTRYRVFRLANLILSENYLAFHLFRTGRAEEFKTTKVGELNRRLREMLASEGEDQASLDRFSKTGALPDTVVGALSHYKIKALTTRSRWGEVLRGKASLPTFRLNMAIPVRCDKPAHKRLELTEEGNVELDLLIRCRPYPRVMLATRDKGVGDGAAAILQRLLENKDQSRTGYRQRCYEIKHDERSNKWWLYITYSFPVADPLQPSAERVVGVDLGVSCPMYAALGNGHARLGRREFAAISARVRSLQRQTVARRRDMLTGGRSSLTKDTARGGHGRKRRIRSIEQLDGRINSAYTTLNHQLSASLIAFAGRHGAGVIQMEDLQGLREKLTGTFLGARWRYHQLQQFIEYKAKEAGIEVRRVSPHYSSRRCSRCGWINIEFDRARRDAARRPGFAARFRCPKCEFEADADYNAARNLATVDIVDRIRAQCKDQGIALKDEERSLTD